MSISVNTDYNYYEKESFINLGDVTYDGILWH